MFDLGVEVSVITKLTLGLTNSVGNVSHMAREYIFNLGVRHMWSLICSYNKVDPGVKHMSRSNVVGNDSHVAVQHMFDLGVNYNWS